jgi:uncharacterized repeat protein (TIGR03843 family)
MEENDEPTPQTMSISQILAILSQGELEVKGLLPWSSNYTMLCAADYQETPLLAVYKPRRGERPLWDFAEGTLCQREVAAYLLSELLGWQLVPPTVLRDGPYGIGSVQLYIDANHEEHLFTMQEAGGYDEVVKQLALFDAIANNADRKSGHCLKGHDGRLWAIDHGICFHQEHKLRTVIWDYAGQPIQDDLMADLLSLQASFAQGDPLCETLQQLLSPGEYQAMLERLERLITDKTYPEPGPGHNVPWPPV